MRTTVRAPLNTSRCDTRVQPRAKEPIEPVTVRLLPPPGGIIVFSGAHLHEFGPQHDQRRAL